MTTWRLFHPAQRAVTQHTVLNERPRVSLFPLTFKWDRFVPTPANVWQVSQRVHLKAENHMQILLSIMTKGWLCLARAVSAFGVNKRTPYWAQNKPSEAGFAAVLQLNYACGCGPVIVTHISCVFALVQSRGKVIGLCPAAVWSVCDVWSVWPIDE